MSPGIVSSCVCVSVCVSQKIHHGRNCRLPQMHRYRSGMLVISKGLIWIWGGGGSKQQTSEVKLPGNYLEKATCLKPSGQEFPWFILNENKGEGDSRARYLERVIILWKKPLSFYKDLLSSPINQDYFHQLVHLFILTTP